MQQVEKPSITSETPNMADSEQDRWNDSLFGSKSSLMWFIVVTVANIVLLSIIGRQRQREAS